MQYYSCLIRWENYSPDWFFKYWVLGTFKDRLHELENDPDPILSQASFGKASLTVRHRTIRSSHNWQNIQIEEVSHIWQCQMAIVIPIKRETPQSCFYDLEVAIRKNIQELLSHTGDSWWIIDNQFLAPSPFAYHHLVPWNPMLLEIQPHAIELLKNWESLPDFPEKEKKDPNKSKIGVICEYIADSVADLIPLCKSKLFSVQDTNQILLNKIPAKTWETYSKQQKQLIQYCYDKWNKKLKKAGLENLVFTPPSCDNCDNIEESTTTEESAAVNPKIPENIKELFLKWDDYKQDKNGNLTDEPFLNPAHKLNLIKSWFPDEYSQLQEYKVKLTPILVGDAIAPQWVYDRLNAAFGKAGLGCPFEPPMTTTEAEKSSDTESDTEIEIKQLIEEVAEASPEKLPDILRAAQARMFELIEEAM